MDLIVGSNFVGSIDELVLYNQMLTAAQVTTHYNSF